MIMWTVIVYSLSAQMMHETSWFASKQDAQAWADKEVKDNPFIYEGYPERTPTIKWRKF